MKNSEIAAIQRGLLPDLPGFAQKGQMLFVSPVGHTLRGIFFDRATNPRGFYVQILIQPLCVPEEHIIFNLGWRLRHGRTDLWNADDPQLIPELSLALSREALPFLSSIESPRDTATAAVSLRKSGDPIVQQAIAYAFARAGDVPEAVKALGRLREQLEETQQYRASHEDLRRAEALELELVSDPSEARRRLESWEAETAKKLAVA